MSSTSSSSTSSATNDECSICLNALTTGLPLLTLSCGHKFHLQCSALNVKAQNKECPLCRSTLETSLSQLLADVNNNNVQQQQQPSWNFTLSAPSYVSENPPIATIIDVSNRIRSSLRIYFTKRQT
jgi:Ring finger domain